MSPEVIGAWKIAIGLFTVFLAIEMYCKWKDKNKK